jgi:hypothetical protein
MQLYSDKEELKLEKQVGITKDVYNILREAKRTSIKSGKKLSMAKIVCNLIIEKYAK